MSRPSPPPDFVGLSLSLWGRVRRLWWVGAITFALGALGSLFAVLSVKRTYRSEAGILFDRGLQNNQIAAISEPESPRQVALRLQDAVMSRKRLEGIIRDMKLYPSLVEHRGMVEAVDEMRTHIGFSGREGFSFKLSFDANDRDTAQAGASKLCQSLIDDYAKSRQDDAAATKRLIEEERRRANEDLKAKEKLLSEFLAKHPTLAGEATQTVTSGGTIRAANAAGKGGGHAGELVSLEMQAAQLEQMLISASMPSNSDTTVRVHGKETAVDPALIEARNRAMTALSLARRDLSEKQQRFTNEHPDVKVALGHVADAEAELKRAEAALSAAASVAGAAPPEHGASADTPSTGGAGRTDSLRRALNAVRAQIASLGGQNVEVKPEAGRDLVAVDTDFTRLSRDVGEARERTAQLESRDFQAQLLATLSATGRNGRLVVVDPAFRPSRPIAGSRSKIALGGIVATVLLALISLVAAAAIDRRLYAGWDIRQAIGPDRFVIVIPRWKSEDDAEG